MDVVARVLGGVVVVESNWSDRSSSYFTLWSAAPVPVEIDISLKLLRENYLVIRSYAFNSVQHVNLCH